MEEEKKEKNTETKNATHKIKEEIEKMLEAFIKRGIRLDNIDFIYKMVDIHKDIANEEYWEAKKEDMSMRYGAYGDYSYSDGEMGNYGRRQRDSRGRYMRGYGANYSGEEYLDEMHEHFQNYSEGRNAYGRGNYGAKEDSMKSLNFMLQSVSDFIEMLEKDANSQEEVDLIKKYTRKISER